MQSSYTLQSHRKKISLKSQTAEAVIWRCSLKKAFLKNSQNSQESTCVGVSLFKKSCSTSTGEFYEIFKSRYFV